MGGKSKRIGSGYERECANIISKWMTGSDEELVCWRTSGSGSVGTNRKKKGLNGNHVDGDLQCLDTNLYGDFFNLFFIDSKSLGSVHLMIINPKNKKSNQLFSEWRKVVSDAKTSGKIPMMLVKARNDRKINDFIVLPGYVVYKGSNFINYYVSFEDEMYDFQIVGQQDFFENNDWKNFIKNNQNLLTN